MEELYDGEDIIDENEYIESEDTINEDFKGPEILRSEFNKSIQELSEKKATGIDNIPAEILKNIDTTTKI